MTNHPNRSKPQHTMTQTAKHTPGPFRYFRDNDSADIIAANGDHVATEIATDEIGNLFAAAPELLAALRGMMEWAQRVPVRVPGMEPATAAAAIAKCEGR